MADDLSDVERRLEAALRARVHAAASEAHRPSLDELHEDAVTIPLTVPEETGSRRRRGLAIGSGVGIAGIAAAAAVVLVTGTTDGASAQHSNGPGNGAAGPRTASATHRAAPAPAPHKLGSSDGKAALEQLAAARTRTGDPTLKAGQYLLQTVKLTDTSYSETGKTTRSTDLDRTWRPADQHDVWVRKMTFGGSPGGSVMQGPCNDIYRGTQDPPSGHAGCGRSGSFEDLSPNFVASLPRDPSGLYTQLRQAAKQFKHATNATKRRSNSETFLDIVYGMEQSDAIPADLGSSLLRAVAMESGVQVVDSVPTLTGREGIGVQDASAGTGMIFNANTGEFMGYYSGQPGTKAFDPEDVTYSVVDSAPVK